MTFHKINEDPFYDEDGNCVDEDADWEDLQELIEGEEVSYSPYDTLNS